MNAETDFSQLFNDEMLAREARAEKFTCAIWIVVILSTYLLFITVLEGLSSELVRNITLLVAFMVPAFAGIYLLIEKGYYSGWIRYVNSFLQVSLVSGAIVFDIGAHGPQYALSSMPPMAYGLVLLVTAFRLRPLLGFFAGCVAALQFGAIYILMALPSEEMTPELLQRLPSLSWPVTAMKVCVLLALGGACSFGAYRVRRQLVGLVREGVRRTQLKNSFGRYVSPEVVREVDSNGGKIPTRRVSAVIMFGDVRGFTEFASDRDPIETVEVLNRVFETVADTVNAHGGVINKYLGDGFLAIFGVYGAEEDPYLGSIQAGFEILDETKKLLAPMGLELGVALNSGEVIAGEVGSSGRCEFTVIGTPVNVAARIEGFNRTLGTQFLVPVEFLDRLDRSHFEVKSQGRHTIRGVADEVELVELRAPRGSRD